MQRGCFPPSPAGRVQRKQRRCRSPTNPKSTGARPLMQLYTLDPMLDSRWDDLVASHPKASVFHHKGWLKALAGTYGYRPIVMTSARPGERLADGIVFCEIKSWITGDRLVSLPFSDHADPLLNQMGDSLELTEWMQAECRQHKWRYIEIRPLSWQMDSGRPLMASESFWLHTLNLEPSLEQIFRGLHKNCIQRRIRKAERERLSYEKGNSEEILNDFYRLLMITRRRLSAAPSAPCLVPEFGCLHRSWHGDSVGPKGRRSHRSNPDVESP